MRFLVIVPANPESEAGIMPGEQEDRLRAQTEARAERQS